jgi:nucleotide-binding universal stress UspA family protein
LGLLVAPTAAWHVVRAYDVPYVERLKRCGIDDSSTLACAAESRASAQQSVEALLKSVPGSGAMRVHLLPGEPLRVVVTQIVRDRTHLLVVGKHPQNATEADHAMVGSVGFRLAYHANGDVLVVP